MNRLFLLLLFLFAFNALGSEIPDGYKSLKFGADTLKLKRTFPTSENQKYSISRVTESYGNGVTVYTLVYKKGMVDSANLYFVDNRFALAREYCYPGKEFFEKMLQSLSARFGQFVGQEGSYWRRSDHDMVRVNYLSSQERATVTYFQDDLFEKLSSRLSPDPKTEIKDIDKELGRLNRELKTLEKKNAPAGNP